MTFYISLCFWSETLSSLPWIITIKSLLTCILASVIAPLKSVLKSAAWTTLLNRLDLISPLCRCHDVSLHSVKKQSLQWPVGPPTVWPSTPSHPSLPLTLSLTTVPLAPSAPATLTYLLFHECSRQTDAWQPQGLCTRCSPVLGILFSYYTCVHAHALSPSLLWLVPHNSFMHFICFVVTLPNSTQTHEAGLSNLLFELFSMPRTCSVWTKNGWMSNDCLLCTLH